MRSRNEGRLQTQQYKATVTIKDRTRHSFILRTSYSGHTTAHATTQQSSQNHECAGYGAKALFHSGTSAPSAGPYRRFTLSELVCQAKPRAGF